MGAVRDRHGGATILSTDLAHDAQVAPRRRVSRVSGPYSALTSRAAMRGGIVEQLGHRVHGRAGGPARERPRCPCDYGQVVAIPAIGRATGAAEVLVGA